MWPFVDEWLPWFDTYVNGGGGDDDQAGVFIYLRHLRNFPSFVSKGLCPSRTGSARS
jgi:hypothetical protein